MDAPGPSAEMAPTAVQMRAEARRRKILEQGEQRINRILGVPSTVDSSSSPAQSSPTRGTNDISSPWQGTTGCNYVPSASTRSDKVQEQASTPQTASLSQPTMASDNRSFTLKEQGHDYFELKRLLLIMTAASVGSLFEPNAMILFFVLEPILFVVSFVSTVRQRRHNLYGDLELTRTNRTMRQLAYAILSDLIVFLFSSIVTFALSQLYL